MKPRIIAAIFARGGSKGVPGKNIRPLAGKPLIAYSIELALSIPEISEVIVSTDDDKIAEVAKKYGAQVPFMRPAELAQDDSPEWLAWRHLVQTISVNDNPVDVMVSIPTTSPLRAKEDVTRSLDLLMSSDADVVVGIQETDRNPFFNMVVMDDTQTIKVANASPQGVFRRQDAPKIYDMTTVVYAVKAPYIMTSDSLFAGRVKAVMIPRERAIDIDTELDFKIAELLLQSKMD